MASELSIEIAKLRGWTEVSNSYGKHPQSSRRSLIPQPDVDPAACMELLRYLIHHKSTFHVEIGGDGEPHCWCQISVLDDKMDMQQLPIVYGDTLELAIATAARDAMKSLRGDE